MRYNTISGRATVVARFGSACLFATVLGGVPVALHANPSFLVQADADELAPGSYQWEPSIAPGGAMKMLVDLSSQRAFVYRDGKLIGVTTIASGKPGHETPDGSFVVLERRKIHHSNKYDDAPMPYMQRLSWDGLALHGGHPNGHPASHGCIRLPMGFAAALFKESTRGMPVVITGHAPQSAVLASSDQTHANTRSAAVQQVPSDQEDSSTPADAGEGAAADYRASYPDQLRNGDSDYYPDERSQPVPPPDPPLPPG